MQILHAIKLIGKVSAGGGNHYDQFLSHLITLLIYQSQKPLAIPSDDILASGGNGPMFWGYLCSQQISGWWISRPRLPPPDGHFCLYRLISVNRYLHMNVDKLRKTNKKRHQTIADGFQDCLSANALCLFCSSHGVFTCAQPKPTGI